MGLITTYTGKRFDHINPDKNTIDIKDIAHALSLTCRGNGHVKNFFSVGQHCVYCAKEAEARGYSGRIVLGCLLHDATEAYMSDVPRPFKEMLTEYQKLEEKLIDLIYEHFLGGILTKEEQEKMDVKVFRIQSATTFILVSVITLFNLLRWFTQNPLFSYAAMGVFVFTLAYFIGSHFVLKKKFRQSNR